jgi:hypothetical protein
VRRSLLAAASLLVAAFLAGCTTRRDATRPDPVQVARVVSSAAQQVKRCYRAPRVARPARQIVTRLRVRFAPDGTLGAAPEIVGQSGITPANQVFAPLMAEAAIQSVVRCVPLVLPPELYTFGWNEFDLTFSPGAMG